LSLQADYSILEKQYRENIRRNIRKAKNYGCTIVTNVTVEDIIRLAKTQHQQSNTQDEAFERFKRLHAFLQSKGMVKNYGVLSAEGEILASAVFIFSHQRAYYILVGNHPNGRTLGASHALIDAFIHDHAGTTLTLDFEGSDIRNLAFFYSSFGAFEEYYPAFRLNRLPFWMKWLKK
jgi:lipid II:glycine glycyltransferase (peptidoglycan interpeptide bridge formation enzyme)